MKRNQSNKWKKKSLIIFDVKQVQVATVHASGLKCIASRTAHLVKLCDVTTWYIITYLEFHSTKRALWSVDSWSLVLIKFKCIPTGIQLRSCCTPAEYVGRIHAPNTRAAYAHRIRAPNSRVEYAHRMWLFKGKSKYIKKTLYVWFLGKLVSFVFPWVLMFPSTSSREISGLPGKQNWLFPSGLYIKCIM